MSQTDPHLENAKLLFGDRPPTLIGDDIADDTPPTPEQREAYRKWLGPDLTKRHVPGAIGQSRLPWAHDSSISADDWRNIKRAMRDAKVAVAKLLHGINEYMPVVVAPVKPARVIRMNPEDADRLDKLLP